jgi:3',5'-cyclic AMP phosphodiesterase CpdA
MLPKLSLVVVSDTHLGYHDKEHAARQWEQTASEIGQTPAELVLHLGDVVDGGREAQYPIYLKTRETIGKPVHEIPGNHDPQPLFEKHIRQPVDTVVEHKWLRFLLLNNARTDSHDGFLSDTQLVWIEAKCDEAEKEQKYVALCMHVPAHTNRHPDRGWYVKPENGQEELYEIITRHQDHVLCLMHGHFHNGVRGWDDHAPVHEVVFPSALYNRDRRLEEQNAPGYNLPEFRPGYTLVTIDGGVMQLLYQPVGVADTAEKTCRLTQLKGTRGQ